MITTFHFWIELTFWCTPSMLKCVAGFCMLEPQSSSVCPSPMPKLILCRFKYTSCVGSERQSDASAQQGDQHLYNQDVSTVEIKYVLNLFDSKTTLSTRQYSNAFLKKCVSLMLLNFSGSAPLVDFYTPNRYVKWYIQLMPKVKQRMRLVLEYPPQNDEICL